MRRTPLAALMLTACAAVVAAAAGDLVSGPASGTPDTQYSSPDQAARRISLADFKKLHDTGDVIVLDVRGADAYRIGHIPGAVSVPLDTVAAKAAEWKTATRPVVTYCTWPAEQTSARAALTLSEAGVKDVRALLGGFQGWAGAKYPVVVGDRPR